MQPWWRGAVIYQIYPRSFRDGNGDGVGDLTGIREKLPYVASLGVDAIWISPFFRSPQRDFGYDVEDYTAVDPQFGTLADFDAVVAEAHRLGLRVLIDMVWSHTSDRHPWFAASRLERDGPKADWYVWADPRPDGTPPNNWLSVFGGGAWTWEPRRQQYYLHHFLPDQPALNLRNPAVLDALCEVGRFWLQRGVDGFRYDAIDFLAHDPALRDNPPRRRDGRPIKPFGMQHHIHDMAHADTRAILGRFRRLLDEFPDTASIAEASSETCGDTPLVRAGRYTATAPEAPGQGLHMAYSLRMMKQPGDAESLAAFFREAEEAVGSGWLCWAFSNHDVVRVATRWGGNDPRAARAYMALLLALRGSVCLYQGEELGLPEADVPYERLRDPFGLTYWPAFTGRDGSRTPMPWTTEGPSAGFSDGDSAADLWLPVPAAHRVHAVADQDGDAESMLNLTRDLLALRRAHPALRHGDFSLRDLPPPLLGIERKDGGNVVNLVFNLSGAAVDLPPTAGRPVPLIGLAAPANGRLPPWGVAVFARTASGADRGGGFEPSAVTA